MSLPREERPLWADVRARLDAAGFRPSKTLGQNLLVDSNAARSIVRDAGVQEGDRVLEIGPGAGFLTLHLALARPSEILAVEIDPRLAAVAREVLAGHTCVRLVEADALPSKNRLAEPIREALARPGWRLVANLPYSISGPLLALLGRQDPPLLSMTALLQRELSERLAAAPGSAEYGALTARLALRYSIRLGRILGGQLFWPRPRVESALVHLEPHGEGHGPPVSDLGPFDDLVSALFQRRRKQVRGTLESRLGRGGQADEVLEAAGVEPRTRPQELDPATLLAMSRHPHWRAASGSAEEKERG